jgi:putative transcriptional regulator
MEYSKVMLRDVEAKELRAIRERMGLLQAQLADRLGVTQGALSRWESGSRRIPEPVARLLVRLAEEMPKATKPERRKR